MSSEYITFPSEDDKVKVNSITKARAIRFLGTGENVVDNPSNNTIDITIPGLQKGVTTLSGTGSSKVFTIAHGATFTPTLALIQPLSADAMGSAVVSVNATNITLTYPFAPPSGNGNVIIGWIVA